ncbi:hypothetical protein HK405_008976 [Cladochytrium tenue]|nr:hypothetical protein HK405_008976 [Cladochytrium tenue]
MHLANETSTETKFAAHDTTRYGGMNDDHSPIPFFAFDLPPAVPQQQQHQQHLKQQPLHQPQQSSSSRGSSPDDDTDVLAHDPFPASMSTTPPSTASSLSRSVVSSGPPSSRHSRPSLDSLPPAFFASATLSRTSPIDVGAATAAASTTDGPLSATPTVAARPIAAAIAAHRRSSSSTAGMMASATSAFSKSVGADTYASYGPSSAASFHARVFAADDDGPASRPYVAAVATLPKARRSQQVMLQEQLQHGAAHRKSIDSAFFAISSGSPASSPIPTATGRLASAQTSIQQPQHHSLPRHLGQNELAALQPSQHAAGVRFGDYMMPQTPEQIHSLILQQQQQQQQLHLQLQVQQMTNQPPPILSPVTPGKKSEKDAKKANLYKTELCRSWEETGHCRYGTKCQFAHSEAELRIVDRHPKYKTQMCKTFWEKGTCPYGKRCCFIHTTRPDDSPVLPGSVSLSLASPQAGGRRTSSPATALPAPPLLMPASSPVTPKRGSQGNIFAGLSPAPHSPISPSVGRLQFFGGSAAAGGGQPASPTPAQQLLQLRQLQQRSYFPAAEPDATGSAAESPVFPLFPGSPAPAASLPSTPSASSSTLSFATKGLATLHPSLGRRVSLEAGGASAFFADVPQKIPHQHQQQQQQIQADAGILPSTVSQSLQPLLEEDDDTPAVNAAAAPQSFHSLSRRAARWPSIPSSSVPGPWDTSAGPAQQSLLSTSQPSTATVRSSSSSTAMLLTPLDLLAASPAAGAAALGSPSLRPMAPQLQPGLGAFSKVTPGPASAAAASAASTPWSAAPHNFGEGPSAAAAADVDSLLAGSVAALSLGGNGGSTTPRRASLASATRPRRLTQPLVAAAAAAAAAATASAAAAVARGGLVGDGIA